MYGDLNNILRCFQPRQWFVADGEPDPFAVSEGDTFMWVYREVTDQRFQVGYFMPDGTWQADGEFSSRDAAAARVNYLNGGAKR